MNMTDFSIDGKYWFIHGLWVIPFACLIAFIGSIGILLSITGKIMSAIGDLFMSFYDLFA